MKRIRLDYFDIEAYLQSKFVTYDTDGKNVKSGWFGTRCLWCDDHSNHLGINPDTMGINCFRCPTSGTVLKLIMKLEHCSLDHAYIVVKEFSSMSRPLPLAESLDIGRLSDTQSKIFKPSDAIEEMLAPHKRFLIGRRFNPIELSEKYDLHCFGIGGRYQYRLFIPIYYDRRLVSFSTRDVSGKASIPYVHLSKAQSVIYPKETLYNIDNCEDTAVVVEGATDVWRMGDGFIATFGIVYTPLQLQMLRRFKRIFVMFDAEEQAQIMARQLAFDISAFVGDVELLGLEVGDPCDLGDDDVKHIRKMVFGKIY
jgi:DNA primase